MRSILACALDTGEYDGNCECYHQAADEILEDIAEYKREEYAEVNELLKALNMEPIEVPDHYTEGYQQRQEEARELRRQQYALENPPVHTCMTEEEARVKQRDEEIIAIWTEFYDLPFLVSDDTEDQ